MEGRMKNHLGALLAAVPLVVGAGTFPYLTPSDLGGRTLYEGQLDQWNFEQEAPRISSYASAAPLAPALRDSLRVQGAEILKRIRFDPADSPDYFRFRVGFQTGFSLDYDGVYLPEGDKLSAPYRKALDAAKEDMAMAVRLKDLARRLYESDDLIARVEGRRAVKWCLDTQAFNDLSADFLRLEVGAWIHRLESVLGLPHAPAPKEVGSLGGAPRFDIPANLPVVEVAMNEKKSVKLDAAGRVTARLGVGGFSFRVANPEGECRLELTMAAGKRCLRYDYRVAAVPTSHVPKQLPPRAPFSARWEVMNGIEGWFPMHRGHGAVPHETYSPSYPDPHLSWKLETSKDKSDETYCFSGNCLDFGALAPMAEAGRADSWRVVVKTDKGTLCDVRLAWPAGSAAFARKYLAALAGSDLNATWDRTVNGVMTKKGGFSPRGLRQRFCMSSYESKFAFRETKERCFELGDFKSDDLFWTAYAKAFWAKRPTPERLATLCADVLNARREYLGACFAGGPFKKPIADRASAAAAKLPTSDADIGESGGLSLDED